MDAVSKAVSTDELVTKDAVTKEVTKKRMVTADDLVTRDAVTSPVTRQKQKLTAMHLTRNLTRNGWYPARHQTDLEEFGLIGFEIRPRSFGQHGGGTQRGTQGKLRSG